MQTFHYTGAGLAGLALAFVAWAAPANAQDWRPTGPVTLIVPSSPGGGHDSNARALAQVMEKYAGKPIVVVNQPGGGGVVAYNEMMNAAPNGQTIGQVSTSLVTDNYRLESIKYDETAYRYIGQIAADPNLLVVSTKGPYGKMDLKQFIEAAKAKPSGVLMGVSGNWGNQDYNRHQIEKVSGAKFRRIPIKGGREILLGILSGDLSAGLLYPSEVKAQIDAGELKVLAHNGDAPLDGMPDVKSFKEQGYDVNLSVWRALVLPKETPDNIANGWQEILRQTMADPAIKAAYRSVSIGYAYADAKSTRALIEQSKDQLRAISEEVGLIKK